MNVNFTPQARADLKKIHKYIADYNEATADRVISRIRQVTAMFEGFPLLGRVGQIEGTREFSVPGLSYLIVYQIHSETEIDILTILHDAQQYPPE